MAVRIAGYGGVAWELHGPEMEDTPDTEWDGIRRPTGMLLAVMVGDDRTFVVDPDDVIELDDDDYCSECGQVGCGWGR